VKDILLPTATLLSIIILVILVSSLVHMIDVYVAYRTRASNTNEGK
jgi:hypothetical protein